MISMQASTRHPAIGQPVQFFVSTDMAYETVYLLVDNGSGHYAVDSTGATDSKGQVVFQIPFDSTGCFLVKAKAGSDETPAFSITL